MTKWDYSRNTRLVQHMKINQYNIPYQENKGQNHIVISIDAEKAFHKIQYLSMVRTPNKSGIKGNFVNLIKGIYNKPTANIPLNSERMKYFPLRSGLYKDVRFCNFYTMQFHLGQVGKEKKQKANLDGEKSKTISTHR